MAKLAFVIPCYDEEEVLPRTALLFKQKLQQLVATRKIDDDSFVLFCNDGSNDSTWQIIKELASVDRMFRGISLSRNRGHQNVLLAGLMEAKENADVVVSLDCDGQDDVNAVEEMLAKYEAGADVVYGVRRCRDADSWFKRVTAESFYKVLRGLGADIVYNHADYCLMSRRFLDALAEYKEVNLFLRGMMPLVGFKSDVVYYERAKRLAGESHYPLLKMLKFACDGITSLSVRPLQMIAVAGVVMATLSLLMIVWCLVSFFTNRVVPGWASAVIVSCLIGGVQLLSLGVVGTYIGKIYLEVKHRPRYIVSERTKPNA